MKRNEEGKTLKGGVNPAPTNEKPEFDPPAGDTKRIIEPVSPEEVYIFVSNERGAELNGTFGDIAACILQSVVMLAQSSNRSPYDVIAALVSALNDFGWYDSDENIVMSDTKYEIVEKEEK